MSRRRAFGLRPRAAPPAPALTLALTLALALAASHARAEPTSEDKALATALFKEAKTLVDQGRVGDACRKFEESQRLDPSGGTLLNLAVCHEREGRFASAWTELSEALSIALRDGRDDRAKLAREHIATVEPRLSWLVVVVSAPSDVPGLEIRRDGSVVRRPAWGTAMPVDPGEHRVEVSAPGKKTWSARAVIGPEHDTKQVEVPPLEDLPSAPPPSASTLTSLASSAAPRPTDESERQRPRHTLGLVLVGTGALGVGVATYFGVRAIGKRHDSDALCPGGRCTTEGAALNDQAKSAADVSTVVFAAGAAFVGVGLYFVLSSPKLPVHAASLRLSPRVGPDRASLTLGGSF